MEGVNYEDNSEPMPEGGTEGADDTRGSDLVMRSTGSGVVRMFCDCILVGICAQLKSVVSRTLLVYLI